MAINVVSSNPLVVTGDDGGVSAADTYYLPAGSVGASIDLKTGANVLNLQSGTNKATVANTANINGGTGNDKIVLGEDGITTSVDFKGGNDKLILGTASNAIAVNNAETVTGGEAADQVTLNSSATGMKINLKGGSDGLTMANVDNTVSLSNVESVVGGTLQDRITMNTNGFSLVFDGDSTTGNADDATNDLDSVTLANGGNIVASLFDIETITGGTGNDVVTVSDVNDLTSVNLKTGNDRLNLGNGNQSITVLGVETLVGGTGNDTITFNKVITNGSVSLAGGNNKLTLSDKKANTLDLNISGVGTETILGGSNADSVTLKAATNNGDDTIDLMVGNDTLTFGDFTNTVSLANIETITGGTVVDTITLGAAASNITMDLKAGLDLLTLGAFSNTLSLSNVENITGNAAAYTDVVTLSETTSGTTIDLAGGSSDKLTLANGYNTISSSNVESVVGGTGYDALTVADNSLKSVDGGADGRDSVTLANATNAVTFSNVESVTGGTGNDALTMSTVLTSPSSVDGNTGTDSLTLAAGDNVTSTSRVDTVTGGTGADAVTLTGGGIASGSVDLGSGTDTLSFGVGVANQVTAANVESFAFNTGADDLTLAAVLTNVSLDAKAGNDLLTLATGSNVVSITNFETVTGGSGIDTVYLNNEANAVNRIYKVESIVGNDAVDTITVLGSGADLVTDGSINILGKDGADLIKLSTGGTASDHVYFTATTDGSAAGVTLGVGNIAGNDAISYFQGGGEDVVHVNAIGDANTVFGNANGTMATASVATNGVNLDTHELVVVADNVVGGFNTADFAGVITAIGTVTATNGKGAVVVCDDGTNSAVYLVTANTTHTASALVAEEIQLLGVFTQAGGVLVAADFQTT